MCLLFSINRYRVLGNETVLYEEKTILLCTQGRLNVLGVIHKPRGQFFGHFCPFPPSWSLLLNKAYAIEWSFG